MQFFLWLRHKHTAYKHFLRKTFNGLMLSFTHEGVLKVRKSHFHTRSNSHAIRQRGYQVCFSFGVWAEIVRGIVIGPYLIPDRRTDQQCGDFSETVLLLLLEVLPQAVKERLWVQQDELQRIVGKMSGNGSM
jgi:hypothetical protein